MDISFIWTSIFSDTLKEVELQTTQKESLAETLEQIFTVCNRKGDEENEIVPNNFASMTAGDTITIDGTSYFCANMGWYIIDNDEAALYRSVSPTKEQRSTVPAFDEHMDLVEPFQAHQYMKQVA